MIRSSTKTETVHKRKSIKTIRPKAFISFGLTTKIVNETSR